MTGREPGPPRKKPEPIPRPGGPADTVNERNALRREVKRLAVEMRADERGEWCRYADAARGAESMRRVALCIGWICGFVMGLAAGRLWWGS